MKPLPPGLVETRDKLHQLAFFALAPARYKAIGRMGLRATPGGFGTPEFEGRSARIEGDLLVYESEGNVATQTITTIRSAAEFFGTEYQAVWFPEFWDPLSPADPDAPLAMDVEGIKAVADWFEFGHQALGRLRGYGLLDDDVSEVQIWPEHFDAAIEMGAEGRGQRASYGASPGDVAHPEPYVYVSAWGTIDRSNRYWNDRAFNGASLDYRLLLESADPVTTALVFFLEGHRILHQA
ncbi:MAG TPA: hypothetical protein VJA46_04670 [Acidimicrobiia bacterium]|nr:hypothetical protein [Acidimicrobiia bacterium]